MRRHQWTLSSYLSLITQAMSLASYLSTSDSVVPIALFDSQIHRLKLPVIKLPSHRWVDGDRDGGDVARTESVIRLARNFFHVVGTFDYGESIKPRPTKKSRLREQRTRAMTSSEGPCVSLTHQMNSYKAGPGQRTTSTGPRSHGQHEIKVSSGVY